MIPVKHRRRNFYYEVWILHGERWHLDIFVPNLKMVRRILRQHAGKPYDVKKWIEYRTPRWMGLCVSPLPEWKFRA